MMDPSRNNLPLQFNKNNNKLPIPSTRSCSDMIEDDMPSSTTQNLMSNGGEGNAEQQAGNMMGMFNMLGPMVGPMGGDPNMLMVGPIFGGMQGPMLGPGPMGGMGPMGGPGMMGPGPSGMMGPPLPMKEVIHLKSSVLYPPPHAAPPRSTREKPMGCRTIFVGGIPDNCTEDLLFEVFENCGPIQSIRISKKNFAHIRFENMDSVERALYISGYRMKINDSDSMDDTGRIHVDYALARDDQFEFECQQRAMAREMRHLQRMEEERNRPPSPPPVLHFADHEASLLLEKLKSEENFPKASQVLMTWLEKGECNRRTFTSFYHMIQSVHGQLRRLSTEKENAKEELEHYKRQHDQRLQGITSQICQVERVLVTAHKQRCRDQFTKAQRKNIDTWLRQAQEIRESQDEFGVKTENVAMNEDMDFSDDEVEQEEASNAKKRKMTYAETDSAENQKLKEENDNLKCQMEAFKNEVDTVRQEGQQDVEEKSKQIKALQNALQGMQQQLISQRSSVTTLEKEKSELETKLKESSESSQQTSSTPEKSPVKSPVEKCVVKAVEETSVTSSGLNLTNKEAKILGLICCFLHVHPRGATVDYLWSYLSQLTTVRAREVEDLLEKMPSIFEQRIIGVGAAIERRWIYTALKDTA